MSKYDHSSLEQLMAQIRRELGGGETDIEKSSEDVVATRLPITEIMRRVRAEVAKRRPGASENASVDSGLQGVETLPHWRTAIPKLPSKREYALGEILAFSDMDFVSTVYQIVLRRDPSQGELAHYLALLRDGSVSKVEIVGEVRWSREGVARGVHIDGLLLPYTIRKWERRRFVGPVLRWMHAIANLGQWERRHAIETARQAREIKMLGETLNQVSSVLEKWRNGLESRLLEYPKLVEITQRVDGSVREVVAQQASLSTAFGAMRLRFDDIDLLLSKVARIDDVELTKSMQESFQTQIEQIAIELKHAQEQVAMGLEQMGAKVEQAGAKYNAASELLSQRSSALLETQQRVEHFDRLLANMNTPLPLEVVRQELKTLGLRLVETRTDFERRFAALNRPPAGGNLVSRSVDLDPFYVAFEDHFRGARDLVRRRAEPYIELVRNVGAGTREAPVLDIGCGRGEWLELLREQGFVARGIDLNRIFIEICRGHGLDVMEGDAVSVLTTMADNSVGAITSMHLVEHLPFEQLIILMDEARRVLIPGGLLLLETPNPENLSVGAHTFYLDPTHKNPIPPAALQWMVQARGFQDVGVNRLTVARELNAPPLVSEDIEGASSINSILAQFNIAPDYAVVARRP